MTELRIKSSLPIVLLVIQLTFLVPGPISSSAAEDAVTETREKKELLIGGICVITNHWWTHARTFPVVLQSAFEDINNNTQVLSDYRLRLLMMDSQVRAELTWLFPWHFLFSSSDLVFVGVCVCVGFTSIPPLPGHHNLLLLSLLRKVLVEKKH